MSPRISMAAGFALSWLVVGTLASLLGVHLFSSVFTTLMLLFGCMALVEGKGGTWFNGRFAGSKWKSYGAELVAAMAFYLPIILVLRVLFGIGVDSNTVGFVPLLVFSMIGSVTAVFTGKYIEFFTSGFRGDSK